MAKDKKAATEKPAAESREKRHWFWAIFKGAFDIAEQFELLAIVRGMMHRKQQKAEKGETPAEQRREVYADLDALERESSANVATIRARLKKAKDRERMFPGDPARKEVWPKENWIVTQLCELKKEESPEAKEANAKKIEVEAELQKITDRSKRKGKLEADLAKLRRQNNADPARITDLETELNELRTQVQSDAVRKPGLETELATVRATLKREGEPNRRMALKNLNDIPDDEEFLSRLYLLDHDAFDQGVRRVWEDAVEFTKEEVVPAALTIRAGVDSTLAEQGKQLRKSRGWRRARAFARQQRSIDRRS